MGLLNWDRGTSAGNPGMAGTMILKSKMKKSKMTMQNSKMLTLFCWQIC
jgi:hypothetical protein